MRIVIFILIILTTSCGQRDNHLTVDFKTFNEQTTLELRSYLHDNSDCGEFGGHHETIKIKKESDELFYYYKRDSTTCPRELATRFKKAPDKPTEIKGKLSVEKQRILLEYLNQLTTHKPSWNEISNAIDSYEFELSTEFSTTTFKLTPVENEWTAYKDLREKLFE